MKGYDREKKIYCGTEYLEVDIYNIGEGQLLNSRRGKRSKKKTVSAPKQKDLNDKNSRRYFVQLSNANFGKYDYHVSLTYKDEYLPQTLEEAEKEVGNYLRRISYRRGKEGLSPLKYILVTSYSTKKGEDKPIRIHHHILINGGLSREEVEDLWCKRKKKGQEKGERIGYVNADRLQPDDNGIEALCNYLIKHPRNKKRWSSSQNLTKPYSRTNDRKYRAKKIETLAKSLPGVEYWEKQYPGYTLIRSDYAERAEYNEYTGWSIYLKLRKKE